MQRLSCIFEVEYLMKKKEIVKSAAGWLLAGVQVASDGLSSARQIVDFTPAPWARYAASSATIVEGEIYRKNIVEGFNRFSLLSKKSLLEYLIIEKFELIFARSNENDLNSLKQGSFVKSYIANQRFLLQPEVLHEKKSDAEATKYRLKTLRKQLIKSVVESGSCELLRNDENFIEKLKNVLTKASKIWPLRLGMLFSLGVGAGTGVITFYTFPVVLMSFGLTSLTVLSAVIWPLAILSAIAYAILIYNTITDLILNETISTWWRALNREIDEKYNGRLNRLKYICLVIGKALSEFFGKLINWFKFQEQENYFSYALRIVLSAAVLVFGIIASLTTGYTAFVQLQNYVSLAVCVITALPLMLSDLLFTLKNSFETVSLLTGISINNLIKPIKKSYQNLKNQIGKENYLQCSLHILRIPLKLMLNMLKLLIFLSHVIFTSVASDRFFSFPCWLTVFFAAGSELLTDICPIFGNKQDGHHDHDHGGIFNWINKIIFILPATLLGILNYLFSQINHCTSSGTPVLTFREAIKQEWQQFDIIHQHESISEENSIDAEDRKLPKQVVLQKAVHICEKQIKRLSNGFFKSDLAKEKKNIFKDYKEKLLLNNNQTSSDITLRSDVKSKLGQYRQSFFARGSTESMRKINKIEKLLSDNGINDSNHVSTTNGHAMAL